MWSQQAQAFLRPYMANHLEGRIDDLELLGHILAQWLELSAALGTGLVRRLDDIVLAWQVFWQRLARDLARVRCGQRCFLLAGSILSNEILQPRFQLLDLAIELLGLASELHPFEFGQLEFELLDFERADIERLLQRRERYRAAVALRRRAASAVPSMHQYRRGVR